MIEGMLDALIREAAMAAVDASFDVLKRSDASDRERIVAHFTALFTSFSMALATYVELLPESDRALFIAMIGQSLTESVQSEIDTGTITGSPI